MSQAAAVQDQFGSASTGKIGMWIFLGTDAMSFSGLLLAYALLRAYHHSWTPAETWLNIPLTAVNTMVLICSSVTMVLAFAAAQEKRQKDLLMWLLATMGGGILFLCGQVYEYHHLIGLEHYGLSYGLEQATFFVVTSFHGFHVFSGVCYLGTIAYGVSRGRWSANSVEIAGLFWHFVDLVWILVFTFIYLLPTPPAGIH